MHALDYYAIHEPTGKRAIYRFDADRLAGKYMQTIASPQATNQQKESAILHLKDLNNNSYVDYSFSGGPITFIERPKGQS